jgi:hypothetical protein
MIISDGFAKNVMGGCVRQWHYKARQRLLGAGLINILTIE